jgi:cytosine/adenosine deaminase-related metal-dependent hydrolase
MIIRARCILPVGAAPIENGALLLDGDRIQWLGPWRQADLTQSGKVLDLGEVAVMPGLINAHCHLDYTAMAGQIPPTRNFSDWIKSILALKAQWSVSEFADSWRKGARMLLESGVTTVADTESSPQLLTDLWPETPLRMISFLEMTGVKSQRPAREILRETIDLIDALPKSANKEAALSPHALYSTSPELMQLAATAARERNWPIPTHLAESESEFQMFTVGSGPLYEWLKGQRKMDDCGEGSPIALSKHYGLLGPNLLAIHANYLAAGDAELLAESGTRVVHCPRSHEYFGHDPFPYSQLRGSGVNICLGTDSLASTVKRDETAPQLDLRDEMRLFARLHPELSPREIFEMVTLKAASALGKAGQLGELKIGALADLAAFAYSGRVTEGLMLEALLHEAPLREVVISGELARSC